jgi:DMSO/TMAO reductase YedYZ molybdopterin-dependent catalytic subunit
MKTIVVWAEILVMTGLVMIACSNPPGEMTDMSSDPEKPDTIGRETLSSIDDYLNFSYTGEQWIEVNDVRLKVDGLVESPLEMDYSRVLEHNRYSKVVTLDCIEGWSVKMRWEGIRVEDLLKEAGMKDSAYLVIFHSYDGYQISMMLKDVLASHMMLAYKVNGTRLPLELGFPFQLVAEGKSGYNWVKGVAKIEVQ